MSESASLRDHLERQAGVVLDDPRERMIGAALIDGLDEAGYFVGSLEEIAARLGATPAAVEATLLKLQSLEPTGVFARSLAECLALQLIERDRFDPAMEAMIANLPALARRDYALLRKVCAVDDEDLADMIAEIRRLEPKPGRAFGDPPGAPAIPDVFVVAAPDRTWRVELNSQALPRVLVNDIYAAVVRRGASRDEDRQYVSAQLQSANWLTKSLEQRARTILNVATEIVRRQDAFLVDGVAALKPLNLKMIGEAIGVHELTVSRATAHKFIQTPRGLFEMKYFFTAAIPSAEFGAVSFGRGGATAHPADDRGGGSRRRPVRRQHRGAAAQGGHRRRPSHRGEVSRQPQNSVLGRAAQAEDVASRCAAGARQLCPGRGLNLNFRGEPTCFRGN